MATAPNLGHSSDALVEEGNGPHVQTGVPTVVKVDNRVTSLGRYPRGTSENVGQRALYGAINGAVTSTRKPGGRRHKTRRHRTKKRSVKGKWTRKK